MGDFLCTVLHYMYVSMRACVCELMCLCRIILIIKFPYQFISAFVINFKRLIDYLMCKLLKEIIYNWPQ